MNSQYKRTIVGNSYHQISMYECPQDILSFAAKLGFNNVTIENFRHYRNKDLVELKIKHGDTLISPILNAFEIDFQITKQEFLSLGDI